MTPWGTLNIFFRNNSDFSRGTPGPHGGPRGPKNRFIYTASQNTFLSSSTFPHISPTTVLKNKICFFVQKKSDFLGGPRPLGGQGSTKSIFYNGVTKHISK